MVEVRDPVDALGPEASGLSWNRTKTGTWAHTAFSKPI
jgi:hypothetical protein